MLWWSWAPEITYEQGPVQSARAPAELLVHRPAGSHAIATVQRRMRPAWRCTVPTGVLVGGPAPRGEQCRRAFRPSRHVRVPTADAASVAADSPSGPERSTRPSLWVIELAGLALGVAFVCAVALGHDLSNDEFWSMAAGQWMLAQHHLVGLDPFSYTESHRRWIADEWGSEIVLAEMAGPLARRPTASTRSSSEL